MTRLRLLANTKVSTTPSSNRFAFTLDGICVAHPIKPDVHYEQFFSVPLDQK
jgi:hypothetical protein